jgi:uncharacterized phage protein (TIGR02220 family)
VYGKIFEEIYDGSLHGYWEAIVAFEQLIVLADVDGVVDKTPQALAARTSIPIEIFKKGLELLEAPDPHSRSPDEDGRRIIRLDPARSWGWRIVNYAKYRAIRSAEDRRAYHKQYWHKRKHPNAPQPDSTGTQLDQPIVEAEVKVEVITTLSQATEVLLFLNEKTGRNYRLVDANINPIIARLKSGATVQDCKTVIMRKWHDWHADEKMEKYLRPKTLFAAANFENYWGECV